ncbi:MAG: HD domain-containing protein [Nitrospirota bacterium]
MSSFKLKKFMQQREVKELLEELTRSIGEKVCVKDNAGNRVHGHDCNDMIESLPLTVNDEILGMVYGQNVSKITITVSILNQLLGAEMQIRAITDEALQRYDELSMFYDFVKKVKYYNAKDIENFIKENMDKNLKADNVSVILKNENTGKLKIVVKHGREAESLIEIANILFSSNADIKAAIVNKFGDEPRFANVTVNRNPLIYAPMKIEGKTIGIVIANIGQQYKYIANDLMILIKLASDVAFVIDNSILHKFKKTSVPKKSVVGMIRALVEALEKRDRYTKQHSIRVSKYSIAIANKLPNMTAAEKERLKDAAVLHDIGKIGVRDNVLLKPDKLTPEERRHINQHPTIGRKILSHVKEFQDILEGVESHHERHDGKGYPKNLNDSAIDLFAKIIAVADSFDAMTSDRSYRKKCKVDPFKELIKGVNKQYDQKVVDAFFEAWDDDKIIL